MKILSAIATARKYRPCVAENEEYIRWLNTLEGRIQTEILGISNDNEKFISYDVNDTDNELIAKNPYDDIYIYHLSAMADYYNGEYEKYENDIALFNDLFEKFCAFCSRNFSNNTDIRLKGWFLC